MKVRLFGVRFLLVMLLAGGGVSLYPSLAKAESAADFINRGNRYYAEERYPEAIEAYRHALQLDPTSPVIQYNLGTALARSGHDEEGVKALAQSTQSADVPLQKRDAWFNLGVAEAKSVMPPKSEGPGEAAAPADPQQQIKMLSDSVQAFRQAILADSDDIQAKHNYEITLEQLEKLKQQQQQQPSDKNKDQQDTKDKNQQDDQKQPSQDPQQNGEDQQDQDQSGDSSKKEDPSQQQNDQNKNQDSQQQEDKGASQDKGLEKDQQEPKQQQDSQPEAKDQQPQTPQQQKPSQGSGGQAGQARQEPPLTPDQMNALRILNLLEKEKPEQFKQLFRFKGAPSHQLEKDW